jgi:hypothetical protein
VGLAARASRSHAYPSDLATQRRFVEALCEPGKLGNETVRLLETHISYVLLTGSFAYKIQESGPAAVPRLSERSRPAAAFARRSSGSTAV